MTYELCLKRAAMIMRHVAAFRNWFSIKRAGACVEYTEQLRMTLTGELPARRILSVRYTELQVKRTFRLVFGVV